MYRFSTNVKKIIHNDKLVLINLNTGQWIRMSMTVYKIIDKFIVKNVPYEQLMTVLADEEDKRYVASIIKQMLEIDEMSTDEIYRSIRKIAKWNPDNVSISGGEPLVRRDIKEILIYLRKVYNGKITLSTNGLLIDKENIETLKKCVDYFEISLDGVDESSCSKIRGEGVFEKVVETVHFLKENGCGEISLSMVICDKNQDLEEEFKKLNIKLGTHPIVRVLSFVGRGKEKRDELSLMSQGEVYIPDKFFDTERPYVFWGNCLEKNRKRMIRANGDIYTCPLIIDEELKENNILRVSDLSEVENGKLYNLKEKLLSQNPKCRTCKVNPFCWNCIATIKENTENGAMDDYCSKVKAFYFNTVWGE